MKWDLFPLIFLFLWLIYLLFSSKLFTKHQARRVLDDMKNRYSVIHEYRRVALNDFPKLDHRFYNTTQSWFEKRSFVWIGDYEDTYERENSPNFRACIRALRSQVGHIVVGIYDVHMKGFMKLSQFVHLLPHNMRTIDLETEFSNGTFLTISTATLVKK